VLIAACVKLVEIRPLVDPLTGSVDPGREVGCSAADRAAVEVVRRLAESWSARTLLISVGPPRAEPLLVELAAVGIDAAVRIDAPRGVDSSTVGRLLAATLADVGADVVVCGDYSSDRGSGSVPAFIAHHLGAAQALGLVEVHTEGPGSLRVVRRLDGGRREVAVVDAPAVMSVEGSVAELRRAPLRSVLADAVPVEVVATDVPLSVRTLPTRAFSPPTRVASAPTGTPLDRVVELTGALVERTPPRTVALDPPEAAGMILEQLRSWGYLDEPDPA